MNRKIDSQTDPDCFLDPENLRKQEILKNLSENQEFNTETLSKLKNHSPFKIYFDGVLANCDSNVLKDNYDSSKVEENKFYSPDLFNIIKTMLY